MDHKRSLKNTKRLSLRRLSAVVGVSIGAPVLVGALIFLVFGGAILNRYVKGKAERAFAAAYTGSALRIGKLGYSIFTNRLVAQSVTLSATNSTLNAGRVSLTGVRWAKLLSKKAALADVLARANLEATNLVAEHPRSRYEIRCAQLRASVPGSEMIAKEAELRPLVGDEEFFAAHDFSAARFRVVVPECRVLGLAYGELLRGKSYRARSVSFSRPTFEALVNRAKPLKPVVKSRLMVHEALAAIRQPLQVDSLSITNGRIRYCERMASGAVPGVLTFGAVNMSVEGIANRAKATAAVLLRAQADLMNAGTLKVQISIPITPPDFSFSSVGSLSAMDLTRLNAFLEIVGHARIKSGRAQQVEFEVKTTSGRARGRVRAIYSDLELAVLDKVTGSEKGLDNSIASFLANELKIRSANTPDASGSIKEGEVNYGRRPADTFPAFMWFALRSGLLDVIFY
jgi:hypothetical protein